MPTLLFIIGGVTAAIGLLISASSIAAIFGDPSGGPFAILAGIWVLWSGLAMLVFGIITIAIGQILGTVRRIERGAPVRRHEGY